MPLIKIISTGGTIANTGNGLIGIDEVLKDIPQARAMADFEVAEATRVRSGALRLSHWHDIARIANAAAEDSKVDGIIVTHGTFTTEETAYFLHLVVRTEKPIVVVASQRKHDEVGNDGDEEDQVSFYYTPTRRHTIRSEFDMRDIRELPRVDVIAAYVGDDDTAAQASVAAAGL